MKILENWKKKRRQRKALRKFKNQNVIRARALYWYLILSGVFGFWYAIACLFTGWPFIYAFAPLVLLAVYILFLFIRKNWKMFWVFLKSVEQGRLLLVLNETTHWSYEHKMKVVKWVYPSRKSIRNERRLELGNKLSEGTLTDDERREMKNKTVVTCPQQVRDSFNEAILVNALIYAHRNIQVLDDELRNLMKLTDENMDSFDLNREIERCKKSDSKKKIEKYTEIGMKNLKKKKND